jgi:hypothetical protein
VNPALLEIATRESITELHRASAKRSRGARYDLADTDRLYPPPASRHPRLANPQRAIGWFLISVGLRLAVPRTPSRPGR